MMLHNNIARGFDWDLLSEGSNYEVNRFAVVE